MLEFQLAMHEAFCSAFAVMSSNGEEAVWKVSYYVLAVIADLQVEGSTATRSGGRQIKITCFFAQGS